MNETYFVQGHRPKSGLGDEETFALQGEGGATLEAATVRAREILEADPTLGLAVVYEKRPDGTTEGVKFVYKNEDGGFEDFPLYWGSCEACCEG
ncbi:MAG: hypothetical protein FJY80_12680 [Candidatus Aminicenantes bacterium]|nr:hypothetical protein [Candidatus Aminicenantes bacterium]